MSYKRSRPSAAYRSREGMMFIPGRYSSISVLVVRAACFTSNTASHPPEKFWHQLVQVSTDIEAPHHQPVSREFSDTHSGQSALTMQHYVSPQ
jgi:hypothetical protein